MDQKREISLPVGYKTAKPKQETGNDCDVISGHLVSQETDFPLFSLYVWQCVESSWSFPQPFWMKTAQKNLRQLEFKLL